MNEQAFLDALARFSPAVRQAFIDAVQDITDNAILAQVVEALEAGDADRAWRALGYNPSIWNRFVATLTATFEHGATMAMQVLPKYATGPDGVKSMLRFNIRDREAERWLQEESGTLITRIENEMRTSVRNTMQAGLAEGRNPRSTALDIIGRVDPSTGKREGGVLGLGEREEYWSRSTRTKLLTLDESYFDLDLRDKRFDATVRKAIETGKPLPAATVDKLVDRYRANALRFRGEQIARTETLAALNRSEFEAVRQSQAQTGLPAAAFTKEWDDAGDSKVRHSHRELGRLGPIQFDQPFVSPVTGAMMMHPGDTSLITDPNLAARERIGCRCRVKYRTNFGYNVGG